MNWFVKYVVLPVVGTATVGAAGAYVGNVTFRDYVGPKFADSINLNGDSNPDLVFRDRFGRKLGYLLAPKDGKGQFKSLDMIEEEEGAKLEETQAIRRKHIEETVRNLK